MFQLISKLELESESDVSVYLRLETWKVQLFNDLTSLNPRAVEDGPDIDRNFLTKKSQLLSLLEDLQRQLDSIWHRSPTVIEAKDINQPTNQIRTQPNGAADYIRQCSARYWYTGATAANDGATSFRKDLNLTRWHTGSQCSCCSSSEVWSH